MFSFLLMKQFVRYFFFWSLFRLFPPLFLAYTHDRPHQIGLQTLVTIKLERNYEISQKTRGNGGKPNNKKEKEENESFRRKRGKNCRRLWARCTRFDLSIRPNKII